MAKRKKKKVVEKEIKKVSGKTQIKNEKKILRNFLIGMGVFVFAILLFFFILNAMQSFEYENVNFKTVKEGNLILYKTSLPVIYQGQKTEYNFYLRNDPRKLVEIPFEGELNLADNLVINSTEEFNCGGDGVIAMANLLNLYKISGINVIKDENATCDADGRYTFVRLQSGNETSIEQFGPSCYNVNINNCEILEATEKLMLERFV
jgi:hypothetical protein